MTLNVLRTSVLAHPDLAEKLTEPPIGYADPAQWNGFIPPEIFDEQRNDSPRRTALLALVAEAQRRSSAPPGREV